jgi:predicted TIM-barrel fold metal-dependent hydrolase
MSTRVRSPGKSSALPFVEEGIMTSIAVIDADGHITESAEQLRPYMDKAIANRTVVGDARAPLYPQETWNRSLGGRLGSLAPDAESWLRVMDKHGMEAAVLYPTMGLGLARLIEPELAVAVCHAYNSFLAEEVCRVSPDRLKGVALLPVHDVAMAVKELRRAVTELGMVTAMLPALGTRRPLGHPEFHPLYEEAQKLDCLLAVHGVPHDRRYFVDLLDYFIDVHTVGFPVSLMLQLANMIYRGVPELFPRLRLAFLEAGCTWVPYMMDRMDEEWEKRGEVECPHLPRKPSEYIKSGRIFFTCEAGETLLPQVVELVGEDAIMYASDWPHWDTEFPESMHALMDRGDLSDRAKQKLLRENARRVYKL